MSREFYLFASSCIPLYYDGLYAREVIVLMCTQILIVCKWALFFCGMQLAAITAGLDYTPLYVVFKEEGFSL